MGVSVRKFAGFACALALAGSFSAALAKGTARVQESSGAVREYRGVSIRLVDHRAVRITSADGRGTLLVSKGACTYTGELERCLPYRIELDQLGKKHAIDFQRGTEYVNRSDEPQPLPLSSMHVPPHGILLSLVTAHGTYITVRGTFDGVER
jgi:hypothetical protein